MDFQDQSTALAVMTDSDWAGDINSRRSTSGGIVLRSNHVLCHWSKLQATIALSSGEAEVNASVKGISEVIGVYELLNDWEHIHELQVELVMDSSAAKGTVTRRGSGKIKHLTSKQLWIQEAIQSYDIKVIKIDRSLNSADLLTHQCLKSDFNNHLARVHFIRP